MYPSSMYLSSIEPNLSPDVYGLIRDYYLNGDISKTLKECINGEVDDYSLCCLRIYQWLEEVEKELKDIRKVIIVDFEDNRHRRKNVEHYFATRVINNHNWEDVQYGYSNPLHPSVLTWIMQPNDHYTEHSSGNLIESGYIFSQITQQVLAGKSIVLGIDLDRYQEGRIELGKLGSILSRQKWDVEIEHYSEDKEYFQIYTWLKPDFSIEPQSSRIKKAASSVKSRKNIPTFRPTITRNNFSILQEE